MIEIGVADKPGCDSVIYMKDPEFPEAAICFPKGEAWRCIRAILKARWDIWRTP